MPEAHAERARRFESLFRAHRRDIVAYCGWRSGSAADAQDAVADVFLAAWRRLDDVPDGNEGRLWLYATARRVIANQRRSGRRRVALRDRLLRERRGDGTDVFPPASAETVVHEALRRLAPLDREVLLLAEWEGLSAAEIASVLDCLIVTARGRLHRARFRFRAAFEELQAHRRTEPSNEQEDHHVEFEFAPRAPAKQPALEA